MRTLILSGASATILLSTLSLSGCESQAAVSEHHEELGRFPSTHPMRTDTSIPQEYVAQIRAVQHIELRAMERGYVDGIYVDEGKAVKDGDPMFQIRPVIYKAELERARAEADFARIEFENTRALHDGNVVSPNELALSKARREKADAEVALAQAHFDLARVRAPFDGIMGRLEVRKGSLVEEGELLTTLADNHEMWVYFNVSESEYFAYRDRVVSDEPFEVQLRLANGELFDQPGVVSTIEADFNNETGNIAFRASFPNPDGLLRHGETGNVVVNTALDDVLLIPQKATFDVLDKKYVYVLEDGVAHLREITVAEELPHLYVVSSGLDEDDQFLLDGLRKVRDGQEVETEPMEPEAAFATLEVPAS